MMQKPLFCAGLMPSFICSLPIGFSVGFRHCFPPAFTFLFLHVQLFSQPRLPFFPLLLKPEMACGRINTEASRCFYHIVSSVCTIGRNNLIVIPKRKPAGNFQSASKIHTVIIPTHCHLFGVGFLVIIEVVGPTTGLAIQRSGMVT